MTDKTPEFPNSKPNDELGGDHDRLREIPPDPTIDPLHEPLMEEHGGEHESVLESTAGIEVGINQPREPFHTPEHRKPDSQEKSDSQVKPDSQEKPGKPAKPQVKPPHKKTVRRFFKKWFAILLVLAIVIFGIWSWVATRFPYATEEVTGYVQSFKKQGWLCKTWEGQMVVSGIPGSIPSIQTFTVKNDSIAEALQGAMQNRLTITLDQHRGVPASCFGETQSYLTGFRTTPF